MIFLTILRAKKIPSRVKFELLSVFCIFSCILPLFDLATDYVGAIRNIDGGTSPMSKAIGFAMFINLLTGPMFTGLKLLFYILLTFIFSVDLWIVSWWFFVQKLTNKIKGYEKVVVIYFCTTFGDDQRI